MQSRAVVFLISLLVFAAVPVRADTVPSKAPDQPISKDTAGEVDFGEYARVGINTKTPATTLDVYHGEIKIGSSGAACTAALAGALRSDHTHLQFCDGAGWRNVSLDKAQ
jgi:hypothetical protein